MQALKQIRCKSTEQYQPPAKRQKQESSSEEYENQSNEAEEEISETVTFLQETSRRAAKHARTLKASLNIVQKLRRNLHLVKELYKGHGRRIKQLEKELEDVKSGEGDVWVSRERFDEVEQELVEVKKLVKELKKEVAELKKGGAGKRR